MQIVDLVARRNDVAGEIGRVKAKDGLALRDPRREKVVKADFASAARRLGIGPDMAKKLSSLLIDDAVRTQSRKTTDQLSGKSALVIGGSGKMGAWTCRFLSCRGAAVTIWDPRGELRGYSQARSISEDSDFVVIASPLGAAAEELRLVLDQSPSGLVFDLCSVKSHIAGDLRKAAKAGIRVTSVHPMFGPSAPTPKGRNVLICRCGNPQADRAAARLFSSAGAKVTTVDLDEHDRMMAYLLGLPHLCTLAFAAAAGRSGMDFPELVRAQGPSFERLARAATELSGESRRVYHDIQLLNPNSRRMVRELEKAVADLGSAALSEDPESFRSIMDESKRYLEVS